MCTALRIKSRVVILVAILMLFVPLVGLSNAITLGLPDISFDSTQGSGQNLFTTRGVHYDSSTGSLAVSAKAVSISYDKVVYTPLTKGTLDYRVDLINDTVSGGVVIGNFGTDGLTTSDLVLSDATGDLLTGDFISYTFKGIIGTNRGAGEAVFNVTGGSLASVFDAAGGIFHLEFNLTPVLSATAFSNNFDGRVKGNIAPVAEPTTLLLLGVGIFGLGLIGRKWNTAK